MHLPLAAIVSGGDPGVPDLVVSVEQFTVDIAGTSATQTLTKGQDPDKCVAIWNCDTSSIPGGGSAYAAFLQATVNVFDDSGTPKVTVSRNASNGTMSYKVTVIEFTDAVEVNKTYVPTRSIGSSGSINSGDITIPEVNTDACMIFASAHGLNTSSAIYNGGCPCYELLNSTTIRVWSNPNLTLSEIYIYTVSDPEGVTFTSQHVVGGTGDVTTVDVSITAVDTARSFVIGTAHVASPGFYANRGAVTCWLHDTDTVRFDRYATGASIVKTIAQVITLAKGVVEHYSHTWSAGQGTVNVTLSDAAVLNKTIAVIPMNNATNVKCNYGFSTGLVWYVNTSARLTSTTNAQLKSGADNQAAYSPLQAIEFDKAA